MSRGRGCRWAGLVLVAVCAWPLGGCPAIKNKNVIPTDPSQVDPPVSVVASSTGKVTLATPGMSDGAVLDVYINGTNIGSVTVEGGSVNIQVPPSYTSGDYALALVDPSTREVLLTRVLTVP